MDLSVPQLAGTELAAAYFQAILTLALVGLFLHLHRRYGKAYFRDWALAWGVYGLRLGAIISFLHTESAIWLYWHQVLTGWTAIALLWAALVFAQQVRAKTGFLVLAVFPPLWSYFAIYQLDNFLLAALPAVAFLSLATLATAWAFWRYHREAGSGAARILAAVIFLWALHHLDYPFLRARGIWVPWGYYLDLFFTLGVASGIFLLVQEDLDEGLRALSSLSNELQSGGPRPRLAEALLERAITLRAVRGSALWLFGDLEPAYRADGTSGGDPNPGARTPGAFLAGAGTCEGWPSRPVDPAVDELLARVRARATPQVRLAAPGERSDLPYAAALPVFRKDEVAGALLVVGRTRDPFTALDDRFLLALGQQVGAAIENAELTERLEQRTGELQRLQGMLVQQHERERERISRELHDETAQVLAAVNLQLGVLQEGAGSNAEGLERARQLVGEGIRGIRRVTRNLRPVALDDLGLVAAVRALVRDFDGNEALDATFSGVEKIPELTPTAELALFRGAQEGLANVVRHASARRVEVRLERSENMLRVIVRDDGTGFPASVLAGQTSNSSGIAGMRERILAEGGEVRLENPPDGGGLLVLQIPLRPPAR